jgi:hypothetical protein
VIGGFRFLREMVGSAHEAISAGGEDWGCDSGGVAGALGRWWGFVMGWGGIPVVSRCSTIGYRPTPLPGCDLFWGGSRWCVSVTPRFEEIARTIDVIAGKLWPL